MAQLTAAAIPSPLMYSKTLAMVLPACPVVPQLLLTLLVDRLVSAAFHLCLVLRLESLLVDPLHMAIGELSLTLGRSRGKVI